MTFKVKIKGERITDNDSGYYMTTGGKKFLSIRIPSPIYDKESIAITPRPINQYGIEQPFFPDPKKQYCEIGPGLGEYIPFLVEKFNRYSDAIKPLAIDLVNYDNIIEMLNYAVDEGLTSSEYLEQEAIKLIERAEIITNPKKVKLINKPLGQALKDHPELLGTVDDVVDNWGATLYNEISEGISIGQMKLLEKSLLKPELVAYR